MTSFSEIFERFIARVSVLACAGALLAGTAFGEAGSGEPGLYQRALSGSADWTSWKTGDASTGATLVPGALVASSCNASYTYNGTTYAQGDNQTWAYRGVMYFEASSTYHFYKDYDDNALIRITGYDSGTEYVILNDTSWSSYPVKSWTPPEDGWYYIDLRVGNGTGGKGPSKAPASDKSMLDAGLAWNQDGPTTCTTSNYGDWHKFLNTDDSEFLYTDIPAAAYGFRVAAIPRQILPYGGVCEPKPAVYAAADKEMTTPLVAGVDYDLSWSNNAAPGTGYVIIDGHPGSAYDGKHLAKKFKLWHSMYDEYETVEYLQSSGSQRIDTGYSFKGNHTFSIDWRQAWIGYFTCREPGWGCTYNNNNLSYSLSGGGRLNTYNKYDFDLYVRPFVNGGERSMLPTSWFASVVPSTNVVFHETCQVGARTQFRVTNKKSGVTYRTDPSLSMPNGTNYVSKRTIQLFADYYDNWWQRGHKAIYGCEMVNDLTGETEWKLWPVRRLSDGVLGFFDPINEKFCANADSGTFVAGPDTGLFAPETNVYAQVDRQPVDPVAATCVNRQTRTVLYRGTDYEYVISNNAAPGTARIYFTGKGYYEGRTGFCDFTITDGGMTKAKYAKLSRAYLRNGLRALYDATDNAGTGTHDPTATVWKDLGPRNFDATVGVETVWADANCLRTTGTNAIPVSTPLALIQSVGALYTIEMRIRPDGSFRRMRLYENYVSDTAFTFSDLLANHYLYWYSRSGNTTRESYQEWFVDGDETSTISFEIDNRMVNTYVNGYNCRSHNVDWTYTHTSKPFTFGWCETDRTRTFAGDIESIRVYYRKLSSRDINYNRAIDRVLHAGASLASALPANMPDGYAYDATNDTIRVNFCANALTADGFVSVDGSDPVKITNLWVEIGQEVTVRYVPKASETLTSWFDLPLNDYAYPDATDTNVVKITAWAPVAVGAVSATEDVGETLPARTYVPDGLVGHWDAIDNYNEGGTRSGMTKWLDLTGKAGPWYQHYGSIGTKGMSISQGRCSFYYKDQFPEYRTIEVPVKFTGGSSDSRGFIFRRRNDYNRQLMFKTNIKGVTGQSINSYWPPQYCVSDYFTTSRDNTICHVLRDPATANPCNDYFFVNGAGRLAERSYYCDADATSYNTYDYIGGADHSGNNWYTMNGTLHAMRVYDRELTPVEAAFNAAVDRVRFYGASAADVFPHLTLPDGYRWNASTKKLEVRLTIGTATCGTLDPEPGEAAWYAVGEEVEVTFTPAVATLSVTFSGVPTNAEYSDDGRTVTFEIACPTVVSAAAEQTLPPRTYVSDGLLHLYDGIDNIGTGTHSPSAMNWYDLQGRSTYAWDLVAGRARFSEKALDLVETTYGSQGATLPSLLEIGRTLEVAAKPSAAWTNDVYRHVLWNREMRQVLHVDTAPHVRTFGSHYLNNSQNSPLYAATNLLPGTAHTYAAVYATNALDVAQYGVDGTLADANATLDASGQFWTHYYGVAQETYQSQHRYPALGARRNSGNKWFGEINAIRLYSRPLAAHEIAFNAAVDRVRFHGAHPRDEFPALAKLPTGYTWDAATETLKVYVEAAVSNGLGTVSLNGSPSAAKVSGWFAAGESVTITANPDDGRVVRDWHGATGLAFSDEFRTVTFVAATPATFTVETFPETTAVPFSAYLQSGLVNAWDGLEKPGDATGWSDLKDNNQMSLASGTIAWLGHALRFDGHTYLKGYLPRLRQAVKDKSVTLQLFLRPKTYTYDSGYISMGESQRYRALLLGMQGQQWTNPFNLSSPNARENSVRGAFGFLFCCYDSGNGDTSYYYSPGEANFITTKTDMYFGRDTLATVTRDTDGVARLYLNDGASILNNGYNTTSDPQTEFTCFGAWYGGRCANFDLYAVRVYDRVLTRDEIAYNGAVDRVRFCGDASAVPDGYRYADGRFYAHLAAFADDPSQGGVAFSNETAAASFDVWAEVGTTATVSFAPAAGCALDTWSNAPPSAVYSGSGASFSFTVSAPYTNIVARAKAVTAYSDENFTSTHPLPALADTKKSVGNRTMYWMTNLTDETVYLIADRDLTIEGALVVGGGGAGGNYIGGGGGGGGAIGLTKPVFVPKGGVIAYKVGAGAKATTTQWLRGANGSATTFGVDGFSATAYGGGGGGGHSSQGTSWSTTIGSGGGTARGNGTSVSPGQTYTPGQGWWGGGASNDRAGGGGGADGPGRASTSSVSGDGGPGRLTFLTGCADQFGSGGGGGTRWDSGSTYYGKGGAHAGNGGDRYCNGTAAAQGYGGGGGGGAGDRYGGNGGSGCVILSIAEGDTTQKPLTLTLAKDALPWTGSALTPAVTVTDWTGKTLAAGTDYDLFWTNNTDIGRGYVRADGKGDYAGLTADATFMIFRLFYGSPDGSDSNDGLSWSSPKTLAGAVALANNASYVSEYTRPEVWCKAGTVNSTSTIMASYRIAVRGGYAGDGEKLADDPITWVIGDSSSCNEMLKDNASCERGANYPVVFQRFGAKQGKYRCVYRGGNTGSLELRDCRFTERNAQQQFEGRGLDLYGNASVSELYMSNCVVEGCVETAWVDRPVRGGGAFLANWKNVTMDNCLFITNGMAWETDLRAYYEYGIGSQIYANNAPIVARNCEFRAGWLVPSYYGGTIVMTGNGDGSAFTNCAFVGNCEHPRGDWWSYAYWSGTLYVELSSGVQSVDLMNCTFAYNVVGTQYGSACINIYSGTVNARNCIFWGNTTSTDNSCGTEVQVRSGRGHFTCDWSLIEGKTASYFNATDGGTIAFGANCIVGKDPLFVTPFDDIKGLLNSGTFTSPKTSAGVTSLFYKRTIAVRDKVAAADVHLRTPIDSSFTELSPAIDAGDRDSDWSNEPEPNGKRINLGCYGNTAEAEKTPDNTPKWNPEPTITFPNGVTEPVVSFGLAAQIDGQLFNADVSISCGTGALAQAGTAYDVTREKGGVQPGATVAQYMGIAYPTGTRVYAKVTVSVAGTVRLTWTGALDATGAMPVWFGHGGDPTKVIHVRSDATNPDAQGTSWADALSDFWTAVALLDDTRNEVWFSGSVTNTEAKSITFTRKAFLRGGFTGAEDSPDERPKGNRSTIDGNLKTQVLNFSNTKPLTLDGLRFTRGGDHAVRKTSSAGDLTVTNCAFTCSGSTGSWGESGNVYSYPNNAGGGANFRGTSAATLYLYDSDFSGNTTSSGNDYGVGGGAAIDNFKRVYVDNCNCDTNWTSRWRGGRSVGLSFYNAPVTMTRTRFRGNYASAGDATCCAILDGCAGSVLRSCVFSGNRLGSSSRGALDIYVSSPDDAVTVENCTFAYNITYPAPALGVTRGAATVKNSIFFANVTSDANGRGADLHCFSAGSAAVAWSLFEGLGQSYCSSDKTGALVLDADTCKTGDPLFVSDTNSFKSVANNTTWPYGSGTFTSRDAAAALDVHLRSHGGTTRDDGTVTSYEYVVSPGVDAADPEDDVGEEPSPNGSRRNLGGYGATPVAARSPVGNPAVQGFDWHAGEYTQPTVYFTLGGTGFYTANVVIRVSTDGGATWSHVSPALTGYVKGDIVSYLVPEMYLPGTELVVKVDVTSSDKTVTATTDPKKVWGKIAPWYGHGGDPEKVVHVRPGATGKADGSCWTDALLTLDDAYALLTRKRTEIWIAGNPPVAQNSPTRAFENKVTIRGGFTGTEDTAEERAPMRATSAVRAPASLTDGTFGEPNAAPFSWLDGQNKYQIMKFSNTEAVTLDRLAFTRASVRALNKTGGGGNLTLTSCLFVTNATTTSTDNGKGLYVAANSAAKITLDDCVFDFNRSENGYSVSPGHGSGAYVNACKLLVVTNCVFSRNGSKFFHSYEYQNSGWSCQSGFQGHALYSACKADIYGTRFASNFGGARDQNDHGGCVVLTGSGVAGSTVRNCSFVGNTDICTWSGQAASYAGALVFRPGVATAACLVDHCTFAYNLEDTPNYSATLNVKSGTLTLKNSVFYSNMLASRSSSKGKDIYVYSGATLNLSYAMFGDPEATAITVHGSGTLNKGDGIVFNQDPLLVTKASEVTKYKYTAKASGYQSWVPNDLCYATLLNLNVHLRSTNGYTDEYSRKHIGALGQRSSAVDAAEATSPYELEAAPHGRRSNLGCYGNTPWSTRSRGSTTLLFRTR